MILELQYTNRKSNVNGATPLASRTRSHIWYAQRLSRKISCKRAKCPLVYRRKCGRAYSRTNKVFTNIKVRHQLTPHHVPEFTIPPPQTTPHVCCGGTSLSLEPPLAPPTPLAPPPAPFDARRRRWSVAHRTHACREEEEEKATSREACGIETPEPRNTLCSV